jgi:hypothetical protein
MAKEIVGARDKGSEDTITADIQTLLEAFMNKSLRSACVIDEGFFLFSGKNQLLQPWDYSQVKFCCIAQY